MFFKGKSVVFYREETTSSYHMEKTCISSRGCYTSFPHGNVHVISTGNYNMISMSFPHGLSTSFPAEFVF